MLTKCCSHDHNQVWVILALYCERQETEFALLVRLTNRLSKLIHDDNFEPEVTIEVGTLHALLEIKHKGVGNDIKQ